MNAEVERYSKKLEIHTSLLNEAIELIRLRTDVSLLTLDDNLTQEQKAALKAIKEKLFEVEKNITIAKTQMLFNL